MEIPLLYLKDKQVFTKNGPMRLLGKPLDVARKMQEKGCTLIHFVDIDAVNGLPTNMDVYDGLTYFINIQVECAPRDAFVKKLLSIKCRVVLPPGSLDLSKIKEKRLLVARIGASYPGEAEGFHDVILDEADDDSVRRFAALGKRVIIYSKDRKKVTEKVWGVITPSS
ncbi:MAG: hypothetical protein U0R44_03780 [Candidatus Micrarchaeia archaeon]